MTIMAAAVLFLPTIAHAQPSEGRGIYHRDDLKNARDDVRANRNVRNSSSSNAAPLPRMTKDSIGVLVVTLYKSRTLVLPQPFARVVVGSPELVDALPMSDRRLYIQGKKVGTTNVSVFDQSMQLIGVIDVEVAVDTGNLQEKIRSSTGSSAIRVASSNGSLRMAIEDNRAPTKRADTAQRTRHSPTAKASEGQRLN